MAQVDRKSCRNLLGPWIYNIIDDEVRMQVLKELGGGLIGVEDGLESGHHDVKRHEFSSVEVMLLKNSSTTET